MLQDFVYSPLLCQHPSPTFFSHLLLSFRAAPHAKHYKPIVSYQLSRALSLHIVPSPMLPGKFEFTT